MKAWDLALLLAGSLLVVFLALITPVYAGETIVPKTPVAKEEPMPYVDEACAASVSCQSYVIYELVLMPDGIVVSIGDMDKEECEAMLEEVNGQTDPFQEVVCRPRLVERQEL